MVLMSLKFVDFRTTSSGVYYRGEFGAQAQAYYISGHISINAPYRHTWSVMNSVEKSGVRLFKIPAQEISILSATEYAGSSIADIL